MQASLLFVNKQFYKMKYLQVTQLSCDDPEVADNEGCFQFFTGETGTIESYGLQRESFQIIVKIKSAFSEYRVCE